MIGSTDPRREIVTTGHAVVPAEPDRVTVAFELTALRPSPEEALEDVATQSESLQRILDELSIEPRFRRTAGVSVAEDQDWFTKSAVSAAIAHATPWL